MQCVDSKFKISILYSQLLNIIMWKVSMLHFTQIGKEVWKTRVELFHARKWSRLHLKCDGTHAETRFRLSAKWTSLFKSAGASVQLTTGSRGVCISSSNAGYTKFQGSVKGTGYPLHSPVYPSLALPCVTVFHHVSTVLYHSMCWETYCLNKCMEQIPILNFVKICQVLQLLIVGHWQTFGLHIRHFFLSWMPNPVSRSGLWQTVVFVYVLHCDGGVTWQ